MRGVNQVTLIGNLGGDPETTYTQGGTAITKFSVATSESWIDKQSGEKQERTEWHRITLFGKLAEIAGEYLTKGQQVYLQGKIHTNKYTDKDGIERYATEIVADTMQMLGGKSEGGGQKQERGEGQRARGSSRSAPAPADPGFAEDEIPFS